MKQTRSKKFCIVAPGGGMTAAYHAGVIAALKEKYDLSGLHKIVVSSGAAAIFTYYVSGQDQLIKPMYEELVKSHQFVVAHKHPLGRGVMNIDFMVDTLIKKQYPLDLTALRASPIDLRIAVTDANTGKSKYISKNAHLDFYELLRASCAVPYFGREAVELNGKFYLDGTISSVVGIEQAEDEGNVIVILTRPNKPLKHVFLIRHILAALLMRQRPPELQRTIWNMVTLYDKVPSQLRKFKKSRNVVVIRPKKDLPMYRIDERLSKLDRTIQQGYEDTISNRKLENFFRSLSSSR